MLNIDDAMITVNTRPLDRVSVLINHWARESRIQRMKWARLCEDPEKRAEWVAIAKKYQRIFLKESRENARYLHWLPSSAGLLLAVALISGSLSAGPLSWMKRHPRVATVLAATASTAVIVLATNRPGDKPALQPQLKLITCGVCTGVAK